MCNLRRSGFILKDGTDGVRCVGNPRCIRVVLPCAHVGEPSQNFTRAAAHTAAIHTWFPSAVRTRECARVSMTVTGNARHIHDGQNKGGRVASHTTKDESTDVCVATNADKT